MSQTATRSRLSPFRPGAFSSALHHPRTAVLIGRLLGVGVIVCFATGLYSHFLQNPEPWMVFPTRPTWLYRLSQGMHVATGIALIPLVLAKLWTVYPRLFSWPPVRSWAHGLERLSIALFVPAVLLQLFMGFLNTMKWYPWPFAFRTVHFWLSWIIIGSLLLHIAVKLPLISRHWRPNGEPPNLPHGWTRRGFLTTVAAATTAVTVTTVGQTVTPLGRAALLAPRRPGVGPQGFPVNRTAKQANVVMPTSWRLDLVGPMPRSITLAQLADLPQHEVELPIACVDGWSQVGRWGGVRIKDLLALTDAPPGVTVRVVSAETTGSYRVSHLGPEFAYDDLTLLALRLNGEVLHLDHGYPARVIAPARPGVLQTKWVKRLEVLP